MVRIPIRWVFFLHCHRLVSVKGQVLITFSAIRKEGFAVSLQQARIVFGLLISRERDKEEYDTSGHAVIGNLIDSRMSMCCMYTPGFLQSSQSSIKTVLVNKEQLELYCHGSWVINKQLHILCISSKTQTHTTLKVIDPPVLFSHVISSLHFFQGGE